jgi:hypothetical protein
MGVSINPFRAGAVYGGLVVWAGVTGTLALRYLVAGDLGLAPTGAWLTVVAAVVALGAATVFRAWWRSALFAALLDYQARDSDDDGEDALEGQR